MWIKTVLSIMIITALISGCASSDMDKHFSDSINKAIRETTVMPTYSYDSDYKTCGYCGKRVNITKEEEIAPHRGGACNGKRW